MQPRPCSGQDSKMRFLWCLASGINYLLFLLLSILLAVTGTRTSTITPMPSVVTNGSTSQATNTTLAPADATSTKSPLPGITAQPVSTINSATPTSSPSNTTAVPTREDITTVIPMATNGTHPSSTSGITARPLGNTALPMDNNTSAASTGTSTVASNSTSGTRPENQRLKFWGIILISLAVTATVVAGFVGCCYFFRKNNF
ncbi:cell wall integrity and stress response component 4-like isoform X2 [Sphaerodactylus townsendi]|uniref:cell wall integrity and stress response component 4-like isoform X2 n=1 Tax=Sphaerodactylus townsendi TaxID=933632 RepID=UPI002025DDDB|nr:cell wall integrity and stress response component 4-like isoform X2 [Sphaerodactylus townsendi]